MDKWDDESKQPSLSEQVKILVVGDSDVNSLPEFNLLLQELFVFLIPLATCIIILGWQNSAGPLALYRKSVTLLEYQPHCRMLH